MQQMLDQLYKPDDKGNYVAETLDAARNILLASQPRMFGFARNLVDQMEDDEALAMLAEIDHRLTIHDKDFQLKYDVSNLGSSEDPYSLFIEYGDPKLGFIRIVTNKTM